MSRYSEPYNTNNDFSDKIKGQKTEKRNDGWYIRIPSWFFTKETSKTATIKNIFTDSNKTINVFTSNIFFNKVYKKHIANLQIFLNSNDYQVIKFVGKEVEKEYITGEQLKNEYEKQMQSVLGGVAKIEDIEKRIEEFNNNKEQHNLPAVTDEEYKALEKYYKKFSREDIKELKDAWRLYLDYKKYKEDQNKKAEEEQRAEFLPPDEPLDTPPPKKEETEEKKEENDPLKGLDL